MDYKEIKTTPPTKTQKPLTLKQAKQLQVGDILYHTINRNADGTAQRWKVNGKITLWKTRPNEIKIPVKHGLYHFDYVTHNNFDYVSLTDCK